MKTKSTKDILTELTMHITRISVDIDHIKEKVNDNNEHLIRLNGRVLETEKQISWIKGIGSTFVFLVGCILSWMGLEW